MSYPSRRLPSPARESLAKSARALAWCEFSDRTVAVVTRSHFVLVGADGVLLERVWGDVDHAAVDSDRDLLTIIWVDGAVETVMQLPEESGVLEFTRAVKERVDHSVVHHEIEKLPGGGAVRAAVRRNPDGSLFSQVTVSGTAHPPADIDRRADALEARVRSAAGMDS